MNGNGILNGKFNGKGNGSINGAAVSVGEGHAGHSDYVDAVDERGVRIKIRDIDREMDRDRGKNGHVQGQGGTHGEGAYTGVNGTISTYTGVEVAIEEEEWQSAGTEKEYLPSMEDVGCVLKVSSQCCAGCSVV